MAPAHEEEPVVSIVVITTGRPGLYRLLPALAEQKTGFFYETVIIANGPVDEGRVSAENVRVFREEVGKGIPYYRNRGIGLARGRVIVYIDDDETPLDERWLERLVRPILSDGERVTVAGAEIPQGQGLFADLVGMLGYPGGGSLGWRNVWDVDEDGYTDKLCTCNCAIEKGLLEEVGGFHESLVLGASDLYLGETLMEAGVKMRFVDEATVIHEPRRDFRGFISWQINRGRSIYDLKRLKPLGEFKRGHVGGRLRRTGYILKSTFPTGRFVPMLGVLFLEFTCHLIGYAMRYFETDLKRGGG